MSSHYKIIDSNYIGITLSSFFPLKTFKSYLWGLSEKPVEKKRRRFCKSCCFLGDGILSKFVHFVHPRNVHIPRGGDKMLSLLPSQCDFFQIDSVYWYITSSHSLRPHTSDKCVWGQQPKRRVQEMFRLLKRMI